MRKFTIKRGAWTTIPEEEAPPVLNCEIASTQGPRFFSVEQSEGMMEYDSKENVWRVVSSIPERLALFGTITFRVAWRDRIFLGAIGPDHEPLFYMWKPPPIQSETGAQAEAFGEWVAIEKHQHFHLGLADPETIDMFAVTVEI